MLDPDKYDDLGVRRHGIEMPQLCDRSACVAELAVQGQKLGGWRAVVPMRVDQNSEKSRANHREWGYWGRINKYISTRGRDARGVYIPPSMTGG